MNDVNKGTNIGRKVSVKRETLLKPDVKYNEGEPI